MTDGVTPLSARNRVCMCLPRDSNVSERGRVDEKVGLYMDGVVREDRPGMVEADGWRSCIVWKEGGGM